MIRYLTPVKTINFFKLVFSYYISRILRKPVLMGMPAAIAIEPTTACNLSCPECPSGLKSFTRNTGNINKEHFELMVEKIKKNSIHLTLYFQGEPFIHPYFSEMVKYASKCNIYTKTSTNAHFLTDTLCEKIVESGLDQIIISVDGITNETYKKYRIGGELTVVIKGIETLINCKKRKKSRTPEVVLQFIVFEHNKTELKDINAFFKRTGADTLTIKTAQVYNLNSEQTLIPSDSRLSRYKKVAKNKFQIKNRLLNHCWKMWHSCVITWDGNIVPCCFDKDARYVMGNILNDSLEDIWNSERYIGFRKQLLSNRKSIDICTNCSEGTKVWI